jgi:hypothetical protein
MIRKGLPHLLLALFLPMVAEALPPGAPMSEFGPKQLAVSAYFDHNGISLYEEEHPALFNFAGVGVEYAPWPYIQIGVFGGGAEFDIGVPESRLNDTSAHAFNGAYSMAGGGGLKLATPRIARDQLRLVVYGNASWFSAEDGAKNVRTGLYYQAGGSLQWAPVPSLNFILGAEFHALDGEQENSAGASAAFGLAGLTQLEAYRGLVGFEYVFPQKNRPFISVAFRPTGALGWDDQLGVRNASVCFTFGVITDLGNTAAGKQVEEDFGPLED